QEKLLVKDYDIRGSRKSSEKVIDNLGALSNKELMSDASVARVLGHRGSSELLNKLVRPRGFRILSTIPRMPASVVEKVVARFDNLRNIMMASTALLDEVDGVGQRRAIAIKEGLDRISESG
ncbi:MAG: DNA integrity scanning protein DisA, partial [Actinobacteria bacterium]|nr:DNA integrity scanning protein DisA [Actinomycetota bacterium]